MEELRNKTIEELKGYYLRKFKETHDPYIYEGMKNEDVDKFISKVDEEISTNTNFNSGVIKEYILKEVNKTELDKFKEDIKGYKPSAIRKTLDVIKDANFTVVELFIYSEVVARMNEFVMNGNTSDNFNWSTSDEEIIFNNVVKRNGDLEINREIYSIIDEEIDTFYQDNYATKTYKVDVTYSITETIEVEVPNNEDVETFVKDEIDCGNITLDPECGDIDDYSISVDSYYEY